MYNIEQMKNRLESPVVTDQDLVNFVQNPGQVPSYLALAELQRRKDIRQSAPVSQGPQAPVAQQVIQEVSNQGINSLPPQDGNVPPMMMADSGVANLPVDPGMFQEQNFSGGGIVAFNEGGEAKYNAAVNARNTPTPRYAALGYIAPALAGAARIGGRYGLKGLQYAKDKLIGTAAKTAPTMNLPTGAVTPILEAGTKGLLRTPGTYIDAGIIGGVLYGIDEFGDKTPITEEEASNIAMQKLEADNLKSMEAHGAGREGNKGGYEYQPGESPLKGPSDTYFDTLRDFMPKESAASGIKVDRLKYDPNLFGGPQNIEDSEAAFTKGTKRYQDFMGDNTALADAEKRLLAKEAKLKDRERENEGFAYLAGAAELFDVRRGQEGAGISRAIKSGTGEYLKGRDKLEDTRDKIDSTKLELGQFRRAEKTNTFKYGEEDRKTVDARNQANKREDKLYNLKVQEKNIETGLKEKELGLQGQLVDIKRADLAKDIAYGNRQLGLYEDRFRLSDEATKAKYLQVKAKAVIEAQKYVQSNPPEVRALVKEYTDKGKKTYGNPEFDGKLKLITQGIVGNYLDQIGFGGSDSGPEVPSVSDLLNKKQPTQ
jgi:hypothetical protein